MARTYDLVIKGGTVVNHDGRSTLDIGIVGGKIVKLGELDTSKAGEVIEAEGLHVLPGVIDTQVHFREPGAEHKEDLEEGSRAAVLGGVTGVFEMPNTNPTTTTGAAIEEKLRRAHHRMFCDYAFYVGGSAESTPNLPELEVLPGVCGVKIFMGSSTGDLLADVVEGILRAGKRRVAIHCEDEFRLIERKVHALENDPSTHPVWRDELTALQCTERLIDLARKTGRRVHVLHVTTEEEMVLLQNHKDIATVEATPQHLTLAAPECYERLGTYAQMNPPIRGERHRDGLWTALQQGVVDVIGSDHAPHLRDAKEKPYPQSPSGMPGVQTLVPIMLDHVARGALSLERFVDLTSHGANRIFGIAGKGRIAAGYDADFTIVDLKAEREITDDWIASKCKWTPYHGQHVTGWPIGTIIRGRRVMWEDEIQGDAKGEAIRFQDTLES